jgi:hypothetical protein
MRLQYDLRIEGVVVFGCRRGVVQKQRGHVVHLAGRRFLNAQRAFLRPAYFNMSDALKIIENGFHASQTEKKLATVAIVTPASSGKDLLPLAWAVFRSQVAVMFAPFKHPRYPKFGTSYPAHAATDWNIDSSTRVV